MSRGWEAVEIKRTEELPKNAWALGYFCSSHDNWDGKTWIRDLHTLQIRDMALFTLGDLKGKKILDIGCGYGEYMLIMAKIGGQVFGQDLSSECVNAASKLLRENGFDADVKAGDAAKLLFSDNCFDAVFSADFFNFITHEQKNQVISEIFRVLKPGGILTIKTPNLDYLKISLFFKRISALLKFKSPFDIHIPHTRNNPDSKHCGLTTYEELESILFDHMFHLTKITYVPLIRRKLTMFITKFLYGKKIFTEEIIITARKPLFYSLFS